MTFITFSFACPGRADQLCSRYARSTRALPDGRVLPWARDSCRQVDDARLLDVLWQLLRCGARVGAGVASHLRLARCPELSGVGEGENDCGG